MKRKNPRLAALALFGLMPALLIFLSARADAQPSTTDHFKCYIASEETSEAPELVTLIDQFGTETDIPVHNAGLFCNPVSKNGERIRNPELHLTLYPLSPKRKEPGRRVVVSNQFGEQQLRVGTAKFLAVPSLKNEVGVPLGLSHFKCYGAAGRKVGVSATLEDQFDTEDVAVLYPTLFCNPVTKIRGGETTPPENNEDHLTCYKISPGEQAPVKSVTVDNQFDANDIFDLGPSQYLCVPSEKLSVTGG